MIVNIAFNTIIYIMVFLFPGIIFRRTFFSGKFRNNFDSGSNFERLLWSILLSILCIALFCFFIITVDEITNNMISSHVSIKERDILCVFEDIYSNRYPDMFRDKKSILNVFYVFFLLYIFSGMSGWLIKKVVFVLKLEKRVSFLKFENQWDYLAVSNKVTNPHHRFGDRTTTQVDIKSSNDELFTGNFHQFLLDKEGVVESIVIQEAYKFVTLKKPDDDELIKEVKDEVAKDTGYMVDHIETESKYVYKKKIKGHIFVIDKSQIENVSITYVRSSNAFDRIKGLSNTVLTILSAVVLIFCLINAIWDFSFITFISEPKRIVFWLTLIFNIMFSFVFVNNIIEMRNRRDKIRNIIIESILVVFYSLVPYIYVFSDINFGGLILIMIGLIPILSFMIPKRKNE